MTKTTDAEYFGQVKNVKVPKRFGELFMNGITKTFGLTLTIAQAKELGFRLIGAAMHADRYEQQQTTARKIRTKIEPINRVIMTIFNSRQITILGKNGQDIDCLEK